MVIVSDKITVFKMMQKGKLVELVVASQFKLKDTWYEEDGEKIYPDLYLMHKEDYLKGPTGIQNYWGPHSEKALIEFGYEKEEQEL